MVSKLEELRAMTNDVVTIFLSSHIHYKLSTKGRAVKIAKTCKKILDRTSNSKLKGACKAIILACEQGRYDDVIATVTIAEDHYLRYGR